jgi:hypothetical protein
MPILVSSSANQKSRRSMAFAAFGMTAIAHVGGGAAAQSVDGYLAGPSRPSRLQPLQREAGDFAGVFQIQFVFDVRSVGFHRLWAEMQ